MSTVITLKEYNNREQVTTKDSMAGSHLAYCEIIYFRGAQFSWIHENEYIRGDVISWVAWLV